MPIYVTRGRYSAESIKNLVAKLHTKGREMAPHAERLGDLTTIAIDFECTPSDEDARDGHRLSLWFGCPARADRCREPS